MKPAWLAGLSALLLGSAIVTLSAANPGVALIGVGLIPGNASDLSGLAGKPICQRDDANVCIDQATLGGLGSAVTYTGFGNIFLAVPDRGPFDGRTDVPYFDRFHVLHITVDQKAAFKTIKDVIAEKIEGLAWRPSLKDGRRLLYVFSDNDLYPGLPTQIYAFAIDEAAAGITFRPQLVLFPMLAPWELPRGLR